MDNTTETKPVEMANMVQPTVVEKPVKQGNARAICNRP
jgi:hypothetical protein